MTESAGVVAVLSIRSPAFATNFVIVDDVTIADPTEVLCQPGLASSIHSSPWSQIEDEGEPLAHAGPVWL